MMGAVRRGDLYHPTYGATGKGFFYMGLSFVYDVVDLINTIVTPQGLDVPIWTTPSAPFLLEHALIALTGACTASQNPGTPTLKLTLHGADLAGGAMTPWTGTNYALSGGNQIMWGLKNEKIATGLFWNPAGNGTADVGAMSGYGTLAALADGGANGCWSKPVKLHVEHGQGNITMHIPFRVLLVGRLL